MSRDRAFSSEAGTGSREENASKQNREPPFRRNRNGGDPGQAESFPAASVTGASGHTFRAKRAAPGIGVSHAAARSV
ncbi:hypothetical protein E2I15_12805 [Bradyrhizobium sp. BR2003]|nr:hypothetical protein [Bradyrhizobium sp. BR2003]